MQIADLLFASTTVVCSVWVCAVREWVVCSAVGSVQGSVQHTVSAEGSVQYSVQTYCCW